MADDIETRAIQLVCIGMEPLTEEQRARVIEYILMRYDTSLIKLLVKNSKRHPDEQETPK